MKTRYLRYSLLTVILGLVIYQALGYGSRSFEAFCPFGGMESLWGLFREGQFTCALGPLNLSMLVGVLILALIAKKAFCGWACPIGFLSELLGKFGGIVWNKRPVINPKVNGWLKLLRYVVLVLVLYFTYNIGDLIFRGFDPFYVIFSGFGHETLGWITWLTMAVLIIGSFFIPMFFCRYLCPMGATFDPVSRIGLIKIVRNEKLCTECGGCLEACPYDIDPQQMIKVRHRDCTNCFECVDACPEDGTLEIKATL